MPNGIGHVIGNLEASEAAIGFRVCSVLGRSSPDEIGQSVVQGVIV
jgi:hypothetical protein